MEGKKLALYAVTDSGWLKEGETLDGVVEELLQAGVTCVQYREKHAGREVMLQEGKALKKVCNAYKVPFIVNDDPALAKELGADGVHVGLSDMEIEKARAYLGESFLIGGSAHNVQEALTAQQAGADYIGCGAVFGSSTKKDVGELSIEELTAICKAVSIPVVAIGGISLDKMERLYHTGINGVAVISALFAAEDKTAVVKAFLNKEREGGIL